MGYLAPAAGRVLVDMSCGSGLFSRRFAASGRFAGVVAADFSESMLLQVGWGPGVRGRERCGPALFWLSLGVGFGVWRGAKPQGRRKRHSRLLLFGEARLSRLLGEVVPASPCRVPRLRLAACPSALACRGSEMRATQPLLPTAAFTALLWLRGLRAVPGRGLASVDPAASCFVLLLPCLPGAAVLPARCLPGPQVGRRRVSCCNVCPASLYLRCRELHPNTHS